MELHLPGGGDWFSAFFDDGRKPHEGMEHDVVHDVSSEELVAALDAMRQGHVEFVTLVDGDEFAQAAGDGDGPYVLEHYGAAGRPTVSVADAPFEVVSVVLGKYLVGDGSWRQILGVPETPAPPPEGPVTEPKKRGGFMSRLRGRPDG